MGDRSGMNGFMLQCCLGHWVELLYWVKTFLAGQVISLALLLNFHLRLLICHFRCGHISMTY